MKVQVTGGEIREVVVAGKVIFRASETIVPLTYFEVDVVENMPIQKYTITWVET